MTKEKNGTNRVMSNKTAALVFSGQLRTFELCHENIEEKLFGPLREAGWSMDVLIHVWDTADPSEIEKVKEYWPFAVIETTPPLAEFFDHKVYPNVRLGMMNFFHRVSHQWYGIAKAFDCFHKFRNSKHYDLVFRCRPDVIYDVPIEVPTNPPKDGVVYVGKGHRFIKRGRPTNVNNVYAYGSLHTMSQYASYYHNLEKVFRELSGLSRKHKFVWVRRGNNLNQIFLFYLVHVCKIKINVCPQNTMIRRETRIVHMSS